MTKRVNRLIGSLSGSLLTRFRMARPPAWKATDVLYFYKPHRPAGAGPVPGAPVGGQGRSIAGKARPSWKKSTGQVGLPSLSD